MPKKNPADDRSSTKVESKGQKTSKISKVEAKDQISARTLPTNGDDLDRSSKPRISIGRKSVDNGSNSSNGFPSNLAKVSASSRKLIDASVLWTSLPSSVTKLGKVFFSAGCQQILRFISKHYYFISFYFPRRISF